MIIIISSRSQTPPLVESNRPNVRGGEHVPPEKSFDSKVLQKHTLVKSYDLMVLQKHFGEKL